MTRAPVSRATRERMLVSVERRCRTPAAAVGRVRADGRRLLRALGEECAELTVSLIDDDEMRQLNRRYRGTDQPTDVLAFAMREGTRVPGDERVLGDVVISLETAARQARSRGGSLTAVVQTLLIHGLLHLLGYDHEGCVAEARRMQAMERRLRGVLSPARTDSLPGTR